MDLSALSLALRVADLGSFAAAARDAGVDPSSASRAVASVEGAVGVRLFHRSTRRLSPTAEGAAYLRRVAPLVEEMEAARLDAREGRDRATGRLRITASVAYGTRRIVPALAALREAAPDLEVEMILSDAMLDMVADGIDLAVRLAPAPSGDLICARLHPTAYRVVASPGWAAAHGRPAAPDALSAVACLRATVVGHRDAWRFRDAAGAESVVAVAGPLLMSSPLALHDAAVAGMGPALLADWLIGDAVEDGRLVDLFPGHAVTATTFDTAAWLLYPSRAYLPAKVRVAMDVLRGAARTA